MGWAAIAAPVGGWVGQVCFLFIDVPCKARPLYPCPPSLEFTWLEFPPPPRAPNTLTLSRPFLAEVSQRLRGRGQAGTRIPSLQPGGPG